MTDIIQLRERLCSGAEVEWFDSICDILRKKNNPTTHRLTDIVGIERPNLIHETRGSKFLDPYDKRFRGAFVNPIIATLDTDQPLDYLGFSGNSFRIKIGEITKRFANYRTVSNTYDGGTQFFFYPVAAEFAFTAIECWTEKEESEIENFAELNIKDLTFMFGDTLVRGRDGYRMRRA